MVVTFSGEVRPVRGTGADRRSGSAAAVGEGGGEWLNCGVRITLLRLANAKVAWEASYLESRRRTKALTQETLARDCVKKLMHEFPYRRNP